ncbi:DUF262 domain-containing protein [Micromonospora sp. CPCC 205546]|uniref:DUF262 domain-containing protein n=1 Tax=Micromonospora sp. CPCC 205546 TaxID=3122397 RepID=UPI002FF0F596
MRTDSDVTRRFELAQDALVLQASDLSLETVASMVESEAIDVRPQFQRRERWDPAKQSALIESFLLNIPVPPVYLAEDDFGSYSVIDGKQRLTAIHEFMRNRLTLSLLGRFEELNGYRFKDLPPSLKNALLVRPYIRAVTLLRQSDPATKYEVFHRLNSGGQPLNAQEIRNVIYRGSLNDLLVTLSENSFLRHQLKIRDTRSPAYRAMLDVEYVLRYFTLMDTWQQFSGDFRWSMDAFMQRNQNPDPKSLKDLSSDFLSAISGCERLWGVNAFKRPDRGAWRDQALAGMYDSQMIAVSLVSPAVIEKLGRKKGRAEQITRELFEDENFEDAVRVATNTPSKVKYRVSKMADALREAAE